MIATWMFGATLFALLLAIAAFASERALRLSQRATRTPWALALALAIVWPAAAPSILKEFKAAELPATAIVAVPSSPATIVASQLPEVTANWGERIGLVLLVVWGLLSAVMLIRLVLAVVVLSRITRNARTEKLDGAEVLITETLGPAVVGLWRPRVAVPHWFLGLDAPLRKIVLNHELEHCRSRDPQLVWLASLAVALMPWNAGVWYLSRRLRLALEIDCDARTLGREESRERYGKLLLLIAQRQSSYPLVSMLAESTSHLSQRITAMHKKPLRRRAVRVALFAGVAATAIAIACSPRISSDLTGPGARPQNSIAAKMEAEKKAGGSVYFESQVERPAAMAPGSSAPKYPADLRDAGIEGRVIAQFVVDTFGRADVATLKVLRSSHPAFTAAVQDALPTMRFIPADIGGRKVKQLVQAPLMFDLANDGVAGDAGMDGIMPTGAPNGVNVLEPVRTVVVGPKAEAASLAAKQRAEQAQQGTRSAARPTGTPTVIPKANGGVYFESQVEKPVARAAGSPGPVFPEMLKSSGVEGTVLVQFVVDENGVLDQGSFRVLKSDHKLFEEAVVSAMPNLRFTPALIGGRPVKQLVQQPFTFSLSR